MPVDLTRTGRRGYATLGDLQEFADIIITDEDEAIDQLNQAEELIDSYVGPQDKARPQIVKSEVKTATTTTLTEVDGLNVLSVTSDSYKGCEVQIIGGTGAGQTRKITDHNGTTKTITVESAWSTNPDSTSVFVISQLGKFPRVVDRFGNSSGSRYYYVIPEAVKRAVCAQIQYIITQGAAFFAGDDSEKTAESIGNYSYQRGNGGAFGQSSRVRLVAPRARDFLRGLTNRKGKFV